MRRAPFITFEGPEGGGKSSQIRLLGDWLRARGWRVVQTREPGGTPFGDAIRSVLLEHGDLDIPPVSEALLLSAGRYAHVQQVIRPALEAGSVVLCDRYADSTIAYQGGGHGVSLADLRTLQQLATDGCEPDLRVLLDIPVERGLARRFGDEGSVNRIDRAPLEFHDRVRTTFLALAAADPNGWTIIDASADVTTVAESVQTVVSDRVLRRFPHPVFDAEDR